MAIEDDIRKVKIEVEKLVTDNISNTAFAILSVVTLATPVGDPSLWKNPASAPPGYVGGRARGNWQIGIGSAADFETGQVDPSGGPTISNGRAILAGYILGQRIVINNNVPYIGVLNTGSSSQAPAGFVEKSVQAALIAQLAGGLGI